MSLPAETADIRRPLSILQIVPELEEGGVECETVEMAAYLVRNGHTSLVASQGGRMVATLAKQGSTHLCYPYVGEKSPRSLVHILSLRTLMQRQQVDILHLRSRLPAWIGYLAWLSLPRHARPGLVTTFHGVYSVNAYSAIMTRGERIIAVSNSIKDHILENYPVPEQRIEVIYGGFDDNLFDPEAVGLERMVAVRSAWRLDGVDAPVIFFPGRITRLKGHALFIQSLAMIKSRNWIAVCAGDVNENPSLVQELKGNIATKGLDGRVFFTGYCTDMPAALMAANMVVSPSIKPESFGRTAVEAQAMGKPVIASAHGGSLETVRDVTSGLLVPPGDAAALAAAMTQLLSDTTLAARLGRAGYRYARDRFIASDMYERTLNLYTRLVAQKGKTFPSQRGLS